MFKLLFSIASISLLLCSCTGKSNTTFLWVHYDDVHKADTCRILGLDKLDEPNTVIISYVAPKDTINYTIKPNQYTGSTINWRDGKGSLVWDSDTTVTIDNKTCKVIRYLFRAGGFDGSTFHYWTPDEGVFVIHSNTWPSISVLQSSDTTLNSKIKKLVRATVPGRFIRGELFMEFRDLRHLPTTTARHNAN